MQLELDITSYLVVCNMKNKPKMHLVSDSKTKKKYNKFLIFMCDESIYEFDLNEYDVYRDPEWIEVSNKNESEMDCFSVNNMLRVRFVHTEKKSSTQEIISLKPVPPSAA